MVIVSLLVFYVSVNGDLLVIWRCIVICVVFSPIIGLLLFKICPSLVCLLSITAPSLVVHWSIIVCLLVNHCLFIGQSLFVHWSIVVCSIFISPSLNCHFHWFVIVSYWTIICLTVLLSVDHLFVIVSYWTIICLPMFLIGSSFVCLCFLLDHHLFAFVSYWIIICLPLFLIVPSLVCHRFFMVSSLVCPFFLNKHCFLYYLSAIGIWGWSLFLHHIGLSWIVHEFIIGSKYCRWAKKYIVLSLTGGN